MVYKNSADIMIGLKPEQKIWACAYQLDNNQITMGLKQKPIYGVIKGRYRPEFFIPFKKNSNELAKSKQVSIYARCFADTEMECIELYNQLVQEKIDWFKVRLEETKDDLITCEEYK